jgi:gas vesicle protein
MNNDNQVTSFVNGFLFGGLIGAAAALLLTPQSGEETRTQIREKSVELKERAEATYADVQHRVEASISELRVKVDELSAKVEEIIAHGKETLSRETAVLKAEAPSPDEPGKEDTILEKEAVTV